MDRPEALSGRLGALLGASWTVLGPSWGPLGPSRTLLYAVETKEASMLKMYDFRREWGTFAHPGRSWGAFWALLGAFWEPLGGSSAILKPSWVVSGAIAPLLSLSRIPWNSSGRPGGGPGDSGGLLGASWGRLGAPLGRLGALLGVSWAVLGRSSGPLGPSWRVGKPNKREDRKHRKTMEINDFGLSGRS